MPAVNSALAVNAAVALSPASSRNRVLMPQMNDAARVLNSISTRYTRWTVRGSAFMLLRTYRRPQTFPGAGSAPGEAGADLGAAQRRVRLGRLAARRQLAQHLGRGPGDGRDRLLERRLGGRGGAGDAAHLAHVLAGRGLDLLAGGRGLEPPQGGDVAAHGSSLPGGRDHGLSRWPSPAKMHGSAVEAWMKSVPLGRRVSAVVALLAPLVVLAVVVVALLRRPLILVAAAVCVSVAVAALALVAAVLLVISGSDGLVTILLVAALVVIGGIATRHALGRDLPALKSSPTPGAPVGPAAHPVLLMNPKSGGGKVERFDLVSEARRRGIEPVVLAPGDDLLKLAEQAVAEGVDVIGMAGGDGSQALVATVAARHGIGFVCVPAGTRNHLAMDLGLDRSDVVAALDAFGEAVERRIDLGLVGGRVFVNNATVGLYAKIVQSPAYRAHKVGTALELLPELLGPDAAPFDLRFTGPDGTEHASAHLVLVSNDRYQLGSGEGFGSRRWSSVPSPAPCGSASPAMPPATPR